MPDISRRLEKAEKYLQKGRQDAALEEYLQALQEDPGNHMVRQSAADLCTALGRNEDAAGLLAELFDHQASTNDVTKAVANYKKLSRLRTPSVDQTFRFAQLVEKSSRREALDAYQVSLQGFTASGKKQDALAVLKRIILLDPTEANYVREGELAAELGDGKAAAIAFLRVGEFQLQAGASPLAWLERAYQLDAHNPDVGLAYARALHAAGSSEQAVTVIAPFAADPNRVDIRETYADVLVATRRLVEAEPLIWELFERDPREVNEVGELISALLDEDHQPHALELAHKLENHQNRSGNQREFVALMKDISDKHRAGIEFLEYMVEVYNASNREHDYCGTLLKLFELYYATGNFIKAADCLDRAAEVDAYEPGHQRRLDMLRGKIDAAHFNAIAARFTSVLKADDKKKEDEPHGGEGESTVLEDLMLQAEIFLQYSMRSKAVERLERIHKLFPHEEEKTAKLHQLYNNAGFFPSYAGEPKAAPAAPKPAAAGAPSTAAPAAPAPVPSAVANENAVDNFARVTEITRNIYRQGSVKSVLFAAVNDIGRHFNTSRCIAGLCTPGKPPSATMEYCAPGVKPAEVMPMVKAVMACVQLAAAGTVSLVNVPAASELESVREFVQALEIESLLAVPLMDGDDMAGVVILAQCGAARNWRPTDEVVLKTIAEQMLLAANNARLRSLVKTLAVTDERSGLLKRSSYLDVLLSEVKRCLEQNSTCSVMLLHFGKTSALVKEYGEATVESMMQQIGQVINGHIRQNDVAVHYEMTTVAVVLADTGEKNAFFVVDKMRKVLNTVRAPGKDTPLPLCVGIAEAVMQSRYDPVDIVTEVINRVEAALELARAEGNNAAKSLAPVLEGVAVTA
ncbi:MAG: tetratricopeptide repeat-containing diguanylate cyclase [Terriglobales bacterium]